MPNAAKSTCYWNGKVLHYISEPKITPEGGDPVLMRGMSPSNEPYGFQTDLKPGYTIGFTVPILEGSQEVRWDQLADVNTEGDFTITKAGFGHVYKCMVSKCEENVDAKRMSTWSVTLLAKTRSVV